MDKRISILSRTNSFQQYGIAVVTGIIFGILSTLSYKLPNKWVAVIVIAAAGIVVALLVKDIRKLILVVFVADIPLGIDIAIRDQDWHSGGPTGYLISLMTFGLIAGYGLWVLEKKPKFSFYSALSIPALLFLGTMVISLFQSYNIELSFFSIFLQLQLYLYFIYMANHIRSWQDYRLVVNASSILVLLESIYIILQYSIDFNINLGFLPVVRQLGSAGTSGVRVGGTIGTPNSAGAYLAINMVIVLGAYATGTLLSSKVALPTLGLGLIALVITMTRTSWGSLFITILAIAPWIWRSKTVQKKLLPLFFIFSIFILAIFGQQITERLKVTATDTSRPELAYMAYNIIRAYPLGVGENNYDQHMSDKFAHPNWVGHTKYPVHNKYLLVWAELGIQGLMAYIIFLVSVVWQAGWFLFNKKLSRESKIIPASLLAAFIGYTFHLFFEGFASRPNVQIFWYLLALIMAIQSKLKKDLSEEGESNKNKGGLRTERNVYGL